MNFQLNLINTLQKLKVQNQNSTSNKYFRQNNSIAHPCQNS